MNPYWTIMASIKKSIDDARGNMTEGLSIPVCDIRYDITQYDQDELPIVIIAPSLERMRLAEGNFKSVWYDYYVDIVWIDNTGRVGKTGLEQYLQVEHDIQAILYKKPPINSDSFDTNLGDAVKMRLVKSKDRVRAWKMRYRTNEAVKAT
jgi:hypothetical protein